MPNIRRKEPLYRKVNSRARGVRHHFGDDYKNVRHKHGPGQRSMKRGVQRGLDYTPLFRFLLSKVGSNWDDVYSEAVSRLDRPEPIFWMVSLSKDEAEDYVRIGESTYFSGLYVDSGKVLRIVNPELKPQDMTASCTCCTHTFNGVRFS